MLKKLGVWVKDKGRAVAVVSALAVATVAQAQPPNPTFELQMPVEPDVIRDAIVAVGGGILLTIMGVGIAFMLIKRLGWGLGRKVSG